jgi:CubicO group peptidase (beta-lactamase class C family)
MVDRRAVLVGAVAASVGGVRAYADGPSDEAIRAMLRERVGKDRESTGIVAVVSDAGVSRLFAYGAAGTTDNRKFDGETVFEIGSITKVLTALILADMVARGEVAMNDPVAEYLPASVKVPEFQGKPITLLDLATYTSALPNMPDNFVPKDELDHWWALPNPFADYTVEKLYAFLSGYTLKYEPGTHYEYANLGFGLLGHALARRADKSYEALLVERICDPLDLHSTRITLTEDMRSRLAQGHDQHLEPRPLWDIPTLAGTGAVRSTANDLTAFLEACLGRRQTPLQLALRMLLETRRPTDMRGLEVGLGWFISIDHGDEIAWKDGGTGGFGSFIGFSSPARQGAIVLSNVAGTPGSNVDALGRHMIRAGSPPRKQRRQITLPPEVLLAYDGTFAGSPAVGVTLRVAVRVRGSGLFVQATGEIEFEMFPETETEFFGRDIDAQITFVKDADGKVNSLLVHPEEGHDWSAQRVQ